MRHSPRGFIERIDNYSITGWAIGSKGGPAKLKVLLNRKPIDFTVVWHERPDVKASYGLERSDVGFEIKLLRDVASFKGRIQVLAEGCFLPLVRESGVKKHEWLWQNRVASFLGGYPLSKAYAVDQRFTTRVDDYVGIEPSSKMRAWNEENKLAASKDSSINFYLDRFDSFVLRGWAFDAEGKPILPRLYINKRPIECPIITIERPDLKKKHNLPISEVGFEIALPGYIWEMGAGSGLSVDLFADDYQLTQAPLSLSRQEACGWIEKIFSQSPGTGIQYLKLLAIEHVKYGGLMAEVSKKAARSVIEFADQMGVGAFLDNEQCTIEKPHAESINNVLLWQAMKLLNARLSPESRDMFDEIMSVESQLRLRGEARKWYWLFAVPLLCRSNELMRLREVQDLKQVKELASDLTNPSNMSIAVAALVVDRNVAQAANTLYKIAECKNGWLHTECISWALRATGKMAMDGEVEAIEFERFNYAFISLLDAFKGRWFSRLHDSSLIDGTLFLLKNLECFTDYHRRDVVSAAIRCYGLNPSFWSQALELGLAEVDMKMKLALAQFRIVEGALTSDRGLASDRLESVAEALTWFQNRGNYEAIIFLREIVNNLLPQFNEALPAVGRKMLQDLMASDSAEALRVAACPLSGKNGLLEWFPETSPECLKETIRTKVETGKSDTLMLQKEASLLLARLRSACAASDKGGVSAVLNELLDRMPIYSDWRTHFLAFDLLVTGYEGARSLDLDCSQIITQMLAVMQKAVEKTRGDGYLSAPVLAGLNRICGVDTAEDPLLHGFWTECHALISAKFGDRMDCIMTIPDNLSLTVECGGWPQDTLVAIYTCRKYLDSRVRAIRETWLNNLEKRGVPYVIVVGDGDDRLYGDMLALNVPDTYESLPAKSLKLFDWVYHHTNAQYILKIDDDCHLNVDEFFDTMGYRKYHYYGRIIRRGLGGMDRMWHQSKSHSEFARKTIDKSPEPSIYADGGGAYSLSRYAICRLLDAARSPEGRGLIASSYMEDKLIGDLLAQSWIEPSDEAYISYQRRRTFGDAHPVGMVENVFFGSRSSPTTVVHLDGSKDMADVQAKLRDCELWPKKVWPTYHEPKIGVNSNQLELLTNQEKALSILRKRLVVISVVRNEMIMLPHFLEHYRGLGAECFVFVDNCSDDGTREYLFQQPDVVLYSSDTEYRCSHYGVAWQQAVLGAHCLGKWALLADADELLVFEGCENRSLYDLLDDLEFEGVNAAMTLMVDMYPFGDLDAANFGERPPFEAAPWFDRKPFIKWSAGRGMFSNASGYLSALRHRLCANVQPNSFTAQKYALLRYQPWVRFSEGLHDASNLKVSAKPIWFAHFKYHAGFKAKVKAEVERSQHFNGAAEYRRYAVMLSEGQGNFGDDRISVRYTSSDDFKNLIGERK